MESEQPFIREMQSEFLDYKDLDVPLGRGNQGFVIKVRSHKDDLEYAMKIVNSIKMKN